METFYEILPDSIQEEECGLFCVIGANSISFCIKQLAESRFLGVAVYHFDKKIYGEEFHKQLGKLFNVKTFLSLSYQQIKIIYATPESTLIPSRFGDEDRCKGFLDLQFGLDVDQSETAKDVIQGQDYVNCYRIHGEIKKLIDRQYPRKNSCHQYSLWVPAHVGKGDRMYVIFYAQVVLISLFVGGKCLLINEYSYKTPEDISYYLLSILQSHHAKDIPLEVSGYVEKESSAYVELAKYFRQISFASLPGSCSYFEDILAVPSHYFSHLFELTL